jgi:hypothetical protein
MSSSLGSLVSVLSLGSCQSGLSSSTARQAFSGVRTLNWRFGRKIQSDRGRQRLSAQLADTGSTWDRPGVDDGFESPCLPGSAATGRQRNVNGPRFERSEPVLSQDEAPIVSIWPIPDPVQTVAFTVRIWHRSAVAGAIRRRQRFGCGCSSVVEHDLAKVGVEGSSPFARSKSPGSFSDHATPRRGIVIAPVSARRGQTLASPRSTSRP